MDDLPGSAVPVSASIAVSSAASTTCKPVAVARPILKIQLPTHSPATLVSDNVYIHITIRDP